jgi:hypothetical protein
VFIDKPENMKLGDEMDYEKYLVRKPNYEAGPGVKNRQSPTMTFMSNAQVPDVNYYVELGWIYSMPEPNPHIHEHVHDYDEIVFHIGGDPMTPQDLGAEIVFYIGGQPVTINTTSAAFIPRNVPHGPLIWKNVRFPHIEMAIMLGAGSTALAWKKSGIKEAKKELPKKTDNVDYEQYMVRSPTREAGAVVKNRQSPTMTYISNRQIPGISYYAEFGWIYDMPVPNVHVHEHSHKFDEIVLHIGGDPGNPEALGAEMEFCVEGQPLKFDTCTGLFVPKGTKHGPLTWKKVTKPHIEMAIMLGAGSLREGWGGSGI